MFKQFSKDSDANGADDEIPTNYKWDTTLKDRLNFKDARQ